MTPEEIVMQVEHVLAPGRAPQEFRRLLEDEEVSPYDLRLFMLRRVFLPYMEFTRLTWAPSLTPTYDLLHAVIGFVGEHLELGELKGTDNVERRLLADPALRDKAMKESGDCAYYAARLIDNPIIDIEELSNYSIDTVKEMALSRGHVQANTFILDFVKRRVFYGVQDTTEKDFYYLLATAVLDIVLPSQDEDVEEELIVWQGFIGILRMNVKKLTDRYPSLAFSTTDAVERKDEK